MTATATTPKLWISKLGFESLHPSQTKDGQMTSSGLLAWAVAPDWVTPVQAAQLMGTDYNEAKILQLVELGSIVAEERDRALLIELRSLSEYRDALWEVVNA